MRIEFLFFLHLLIASVVSGFGTIQQHRLRSLTVLHRLDQISLRSTPNNDDDNDDNEASINVLGTRMECCCANVQNTGVGTGFYRNGYCSTGAQDVGRHTVCVRVSPEFLQFSKSVGNDLSTPFPEYAFPGLKEGDIWCLCAQRWAQAYEFGKAPKLYLKATHEKTLDYVDFKVLREYALDGSEADEEKGALDEKRDQLEKLFGQEAEESSE
mmetsp:Transcript_18347/g.21936  ORF Transcript_18347/g.21936 Transcript_18347/m.21936 type:complete len:212 (+) Transcript_18347:37-672(+)